MLRFLKEHAFLPCEIVAFTPKGPSIYHDSSYLVAIWVPKVHAKLVLGPFGHHQVVGFPLLDQVLSMACFAFMTQPDEDPGRLAIFGRMVSILPGPQA